jgi:hypothetical protein
MTSEQYAALHQRMTNQRDERQWLSRSMDSDKGVGLRSGDLIQAHVGGEIREVEAVGGAGECLEARADEWARLAREKKREN